jgi:hypothetical protein
MNSAFQFDEGLALLAIASMNGTTEVAMTRQSSLDVDQFKNRAFNDLQQIWEKEGFGKPPRLRRKLLSALLAYRLQQRAYGGVDSEIARKLVQIAGESGRKPKLGAALEFRIKPGTRLQRVWRNELHEVTALGTNFAYRGKTYENLSVIARDITGTRWSGPAFFGLKDKPSKSVERRP